MAPLRWPGLCAGLCVFLWCNVSAAAPVLIPADQAAARPRADPGTGLCLTAIHAGLDNSFSALDVDVIPAFTLPVGTGNIVGRDVRPLPVVNLRNADPGAVLDYSPDGDPAQLFPFSSAPGAAQPGNDKNFAARARGYLGVSNAGTVTLAITADSGYRLTIGRTLVLESPGGRSARDTRQVQLAAAGLYPIELIAFHNSGPAYLQLGQAAGAQPEVLSAPARLPGFALVPTAQLYSAQVGNSDCFECSDVATCGEGRFCDAGLCQRCLVDLKCGASCLPCPVDRPYCDPEVGAGRCVACRTDSQCGATARCDVASGSCAPIIYTLEGGRGCGIARPSAGPAAGPILMLAALLLGLMRSFARARGR